MTPSRRPKQVFQTILCPIDFSPHAALALQYAVAAARRSHGKVTALYVNNPLLIAAAAAAAYDERALVRTSLAELKQFVAQFAGKAGAARVEPSVAIGEAAREIKRAARRLSSDLIVVGTHGLSGPGKLFFGSTTERVLRQATVPILAVPPRGKAARPPASWPGARLIAAIDLGSEARADARAAADVARGFGADLVLAHVVPPNQAPRWLTLRLRDRSQARLADARTKLARLATELNADARVLPGDPAQQIAALAADTRAGLVIVTLRPGEGAFGAQQGSITYRVLSGGGTVPILALPGHARRSRRVPTPPDPSAFT